MFLHSFSDELTKLAINTDRLSNEARERLTYGTGVKAGRDFARGAMRRVGLDPDRDEHKALAAAGVAAPVGAVGVSGMRQRRRIRRLERAMAQRQATRQARRASVGSKAKKILKKIVRRGR